MIFFFRSMNLNTDFQTYKIKAVTLMLSTFFEQAYLQQLSDWSPADIRLSVGEITKFTITGAEIICGQLWQAQVLKYYEMPSGVRVNDVVHRSSAFLSQQGCTSTISSWYRKGWGTGDVVISLLSTALHWII